MNQQLYKNMMDARRSLIDARTTLALIRKQRNWESDFQDACIRAGERAFLKALDRAWDTQCMAQGSF